MEEAEDYQELVITRKTELGRSIQGKTDAELFNSPFQEPGTYMIF